jgi:hypothetical protein
MSTAVLPANNVDGTALGRKPKGEATVPARVLRVVLQNLAPHKRSLYFDHRKPFREALVNPLPAHFHLGGVFRTQSLWLLFEYADQG